MKKTVMFSLIILFSIIYCPTEVSAEENSLGYTVSAISNSNQIDIEKSYFYLQTSPGKEQVVKAKLTSTKKESVSINIRVADAVTGDEGTIEYLEDKSKQDNSLIDPLSSLTKIDPSKVTIGNFEEKEILIKINPPKQSYKGIKMGAIIFELDNADQKESVKNKFAYRISLIISESGDEYSDSKTLNNLEAKATIKRGKKMILMGLQNPEPKILKNLYIEADIKLKGSDAVIKKKSTKNYVLAPNSNFDFEFDWGTDSIKAGTYIVSMNAKNDYNEWNFQKEVIVTAEQARDLNESSGIKIVTPEWIKVLSGVFVILIIIINTYIIQRRIKMEKSWKKIKKNKKKKKKVRVV